MRQLIAIATYFILGTAAVAATVEKQIIFKSTDGTTLRGTLLLPGDDSSARYPALVLLQGSGPTNRDGNQAPLLVTNFLKQIAESLAEHGIATLRFDKRGMYANAVELPKDRNRYSEFFSWENFVADARSAYEFLSTQLQIDPRASEFSATAKADRWL